MNKDACRTQNGTPPSVLEGQPLGIRGIAGLVAEGDGVTMGVDPLGIRASAEREEEDDQDDENDEQPLAACRPRLGIG